MTQHDKLEACNCKHAPTTLSLHRGEGSGYYLRHPEKGFIFWTLKGEDIVEHLMHHYPGSTVEVYCDFDAGPYGRVQGSQDDPLTLEWFMD